MGCESVEFKRNEKGKYKLKVNKPLEFEKNTCVCLCHRNVLTLIIFWNFFGVKKRSTIRNKERPKPKAASNINNTENIEEI